MKIVNGRWISSTGERINHFNFKDFKSLSDKVVCLYGNNITHDRIDLVSNFISLTAKEENTLNNLFKSKLLEKF